MSVCRFECGPSVVFSVAWSAGATLVWRIREEVLIMELLQCQ
jgi:hypothetical protein